MASSACAAAFNPPMLPGNPCGIPIHTSARASTPEATARSAQLMVCLLASFILYRIKTASSKLSRGLRGWSLLESP